MISNEDYLWYVDTALDSMLGIVRSLGDDLANRVPDLPGANAPYAILTHCLGVMAYWGGEVVAGRTIERDRPAEFVATGPVADLVERAREARRQFAIDVGVAEHDAPPRGAVPPADAAIPIGRTQGGALFHVYEELSQHLGQMEISRDMLQR